MLLPEQLWGGVPAKVIGRFEQLKNSRKEYTNKVLCLDINEKNKFLWDEFYKEHNFK